MQQQKNARLGYMAGSLGITPAMAHANLLDSNVRGYPPREAKQKKGLDYSIDSINLDSGGDTVSPNASNLYIPQNSTGMVILNEGSKFSK